MTWPGVGAYGSGSRDVRAATRQPDPGSAWTATAGQAARRHTKVTAVARRAMRIPRYGMS
ncbi:hypothetical protein GCM10022248_29180 [Nonomuraea soli]